MQHLVHSIQISFLECMLTGTANVYDWPCVFKGTTINDLGEGREEIGKKNFLGPSPGGKNWR